MCDQTNAVNIVGELMQYLEKADYSVRETLVSACIFMYNYILTS